MSWQCPYCQHHATLSENADTTTNDIALFDDTALGNLRMVSVAIRCPNNKCKQITLTVLLKKIFGSSWDTNARYTPIERFRLKPESNAKPQPNYIPAQIVQDYYEACRIRDLSPKASATLARRCLQGIISNFWGIKKKNLKAAIEALNKKKEVSSQVIKAIDAIRKVGNIGAHMEKDVNLIIDVTPEEAGKLVGLIEYLFKEWYIHKHEAEEGLEKIIAIGDEKEKNRKEAKEKSSESAV